MGGWLLLAREAGWGPGILGEIGGAQALLSAEEALLGGGRREVTDVGDLGRA